MIIQRTRTQVRHSKNLELTEPEMAYNKRVGKSFHDLGMEVLPRPSPPTEVAFSIKFSDLILSVRDTKVKANVNACRVTET